MKRILKIYYILFTCLIGSSIVIITYLYNSYDEKLLLGLIGIIATFYFGLSKTQMENDRFFKELFRDFNLRYTALNECLYNITNSDKTIEDLSFREKDKIYDYFNLCAEEYYWYKKNRISPTVWKSWKNGMDFWYSKPIIREMWEEEITNNNSRLSYYMESNEDFFKD
ncbi:hypothetical protein [Winogradskyella rapida]|uniref:DUF4760 domain-containing protein n=1 Tax=Winogradskyella rapida TaxID=549701 RepID=A0ABW3KSU9_9FLAO